MSWFAIISYFHFLFFYLFICLFICLCIYLFIYLYIYIFIIYLFLFLACCFCFCFVFSFYFWINNSFSDMKWLMLVNYFVCLLVCFVSWAEIVYSKNLQHHWFSPVPKRFKNLCTYCYFNIHFILSFTIFVITHFIISFS